MSLFKDDAYADLTDQERDQLADRACDHTPDAFLAAFPAYHYRLPVPRPRGAQERAAQAAVRPQPSGTVTPLGAAAPPVQSTDRKAA